jgi:hypothetical protein
MEFQQVFKPNLFGQEIISFPQDIDDHPEQDHQSAHNAQALAI